MSEEQPQQESTKKCKQTELYWQHPTEEDVNVTVDSSNWMLNYKSDKTRFYTTKQATINAMVSRSFIDKLKDIPVEDKTSLTKMLEHEKAFRKEIMEMFK